MVEKIFTLKRDGGQEIFVYSWIPEGSGEPVGIVQISHGMAEHAWRYKELAEYMNTKGFAVYANDHRGHGKTAGTVDNLGYFADKDGWDIVVDDMFAVSEYIKKKHGGIPLILLGHSMGSFLVRDYITRNKIGLKGVILSGTASDPGLLGEIGILIAKISCKLRGKKHPNKLLDNLSFGTFNKEFKNARTKFDWLSRDEKNVDKYIEDKFCGGIFSSGFFLDLFTGIKRVNKKASIKKVPPDLPVLFLSGEKDPVGKNLKGVRKVADLFKKSGVNDITLKFYSGGRHEMLNEINRSEVYSDINDWINKKLKK